MIVTKEEAKRKTCPLPDMNECLGDKCMWWEWIGGLPPEDPRAQGYCGGSIKRKPGDS